jgi:NAD-dependent deacetylase
MVLTPDAERTIAEVAARLRPEHRLLFVTGAGISADSGLPTYRGVGGLYAGGLPATHGISIEELLSGAMFEVRPDLTWTYLNEVIKACRGATFNRGHRVIAELEGHFAGVWTLTQNVDGFHRAAGARNVIEIHGDIRTLRCTGRACDWSGTLREESEFAELPPRCMRCGSVIRPDVVLFGEMLPVSQVETLRREQERGFDWVISVGTSSLFPYILEPLWRAKERGSPTVEINPGRTDVSDIVDYRVVAGAAETLDALWSAYRNRNHIN